MNTLLKNRGTIVPLWLTLSWFVPSQTWSASTWDGGGNNNNWSTRNNWSSNTVPANNGTADLVFDGSKRPSNTMDGAWSVNTLTFASTAGNFTITGTNTLTLGNGITNNDSGTQTLDVNTALAAAQTWTSDSGSLVVGALGASRTLSNNGHTLTLNGTGTITLNAQINGSGGLIKNGSGTATLSYGESSDASLSTYTGTTTVNAGVLYADLGADDASPLTPLTGTITVGGGADTATFETRWLNQVGDNTTINVLGNGTFRVSSATYNGQFPSPGNLAETIGNLNLSGGATVATVSGASSVASLVLNGNVSHDGNGSTSATITGNLSLGGATRTFSIADSTAAADLNVAAVISNGGIQKSGAGTLTLGGNNTYTGPTTVSAGTLVINGNQGSATGAVSVANGAILAGTGTIGGATTVSSGASLAPGAVGDPGQQTFSNSLAFEPGSIFVWDLDAATSDSGSSNQGNYDKIVANGTVSGTSTFKIVLGSNAFTDAFWDTNKTWTDIFSGSGTIALNTLFTTFSGAGVSADGHVAGRGHFSFADNSLKWSTNPEPSSLLAGLLLAAGILRRRRA